LLARRLDGANQAFIELKRQVEAGEPRSVIGKTVERIEVLLGASGGNLAYGGYPYDPFAPTFEQLKCTGVHRLLRSATSVITAAARRARVLRVHSLQPFGREQCRLKRSFVRSARAWSAPLFSGLIADVRPDWRPHINKPRRGRSR
jgi:hypothetical protein